MTQTQLLIAGGLVALAVFAFAAKRTYPTWGRVIRQSGNRQ